ncbi:MAG: polysaccharide biosynthesis protein, partial [Lachnospiraceae bacterium]|nr:polysaccharide biosynthesis protein [Lachnospiraceae bacterium]
MKNFRPGVLYVRKAFLIIFDIMAVLVASVLAIAMRFDFDLNSIPTHFMNNVWSYMIINVVTTLIVFWIFRLYNSLWRFAGAQEFQNMVMACFINAVLLFLGTKVLALAVPRSYYFMFGFWQLAFTFASRFAYRFLRSLRKRQINEKLGNNVMIVGAGEATSLLLKEILNSDFVHMTVKCIVDDDVNKQGRYIQGVKVCGTRNDIVRLAEKYDIDEIIISMPAVSRKVRSEILAICQETNCKLQTLPGMYQLVNNEISVSKLRDVEVEDLLGRDPVAVDLNSILGYVQNKTVLVTGGGGSIGSELCRQIASHRPKHLIIVDIYENSVYDIQQELKHDHPDMQLTVLIASVRNTARMEYIFATYKPDIVYHAAAHKHVPLMEDSPHEAIKNNVFGTYKTANAAGKNGV